VKKDNIYDAIGRPDLKPVQKVARSEWELSSRELDIYENPELLRGGL